MPFRYRVNEKTKILEIDVEGTVNPQQASEMYNLIIREFKKTGKHCGKALMTIWDHGSLQGNSLSILRSSLEWGKKHGMKKVALVIPYWRGRPKSWFFSSREEALLYLQSP